MSKKLSCSGMGLVEVIVASVIGTIILVALTNGILNSMKSSAGVDVKIQVQEFQRQVNSTLSSTSQCRSMFGVTRNASNDLIDANPALATEAFKVMDKSTLPTTAVPAILQVPVPAMAVSGTSYTAGTSKFRNLTVKEFKLTILGPPLAGNPNLYPASLTYVLNTTANVNGPSEFLRSSSVNVLIANHPKTPAGSFVQLSDCYSGGTDSDGETTCETIGGRWLFGTESLDPTTKEPAAFMPKDRCTFGTGAMTLSVDEGPDEVPRNGGRNALGERIEKCKYTSGYQNLREEDCGASVYPARGYRCFYNTSTHQWQKRYFAANTRDPSSTVYRVCDKGVSVSLNSSESDELPMNRHLKTSTAFSADIGALTDANLDKAVQRRLGSITACQYLMTSEKYVNCSNSIDITEAQLGDVGSCIWVNNTKLYFSSIDQANFYQAHLNLFTGYDGTAATFKFPYSNNFYMTSGTSFLTAYTALPSSREVAETVAPPDGAGGWMRVTIKRKYKFNSMVEARGLPCFAVQVNGSGFIAPHDDAPTLVNTNPLVALAISAADKDDSDLMKPHYEKVKECHYDSPFTSVVDPAIVATREYSTVLSCTANGDIEGIEVSAAGAAVTLPKKSCWYVKNARISGHYSKVLAPPTVVAPIASIVARTLAKDARYTGWVFFTSEVNNGQLPAANAVDSDLALKPDNTLAGIPCNQGVTIAP